MTSRVTLHGHGGSGTVTGSCHRLTSRKADVLVDVGAFQGSKALTERNREPFDFAADRLDAVVLTHGHLDHVGRLPQLVAAGYRGTVHAAPGTKAIAEVILRDAAKIAEEDRARAIRRARRAGRADSVPPLPFRTEDVDAALAAIVERAYGQPFTCNDVTLTFHPAGHVVGSAWIWAEVDDVRVAFSGDLGNREGILHPAASAPVDATALVVESTYGDRTHRSRDDTRHELASVLRNAVERGGHVLVPSFALERTQAILYEIARGQREGTIPPVPVFLDSPMAASMTDVYRRHPTVFRDEVQAACRSGQGAFTPPWFEATTSVEASRSLNDRDGPAIVVAGSGMMTGGRILHHLKHHLWKPTTHVVIVGYQARGTLGRALVDGADHVRIHGERIAVAATVHTIGGLSAHADRDDLDAWVSRSPEAKVHLVHAEPHVAASYRDRLRSAGRSAVVVREGVTYHLSARRRHPGPDHGPATGRSDGQP